MRVRCGERVGRAPWVVASLVAAGLIHAANGKSQVQEGAGLPGVSAAAVHEANSGRVFREIRDPHTRLTWLLERNAENPAGPGRMVAAEDDRSADGKCYVIRTGDRVLVEERTGVVEALLEGVALGTAAVGSRLEVRLKIGGGVVKTVALAPGLAALVPSAETRR